MHFVKPNWLTHPGENKDFEVYSCHVSPDGARLATGAGDGHVRIWSTEAITNSANPEYTKPKQLAAVSNHSGTILTVRFSGNNKYLASGADDRVVCIYALDPNPPAHSTFGSNEAPNVENWRVLRRLIGHDNDVQDLGWSYDSTILVSVGLDSKIVVWSGHTFEKLKTINSHQSHVKGITFDPANKYFATASDDRTIKIFQFTSPPPTASSQDQVNNFTLAKTIVNPFVSSPLSTYFRRCSWSPDGNHIAAANAVNGPVSSVAIVSRGTWESDINLIGHEGPVEVCAFSPRMFYREPVAEGQVDAQGHSPPSVTVIACAGQDKTLSVWNTSYSRPFVITQELASKPLTDLAWTPSGEVLFMTSLDGSIMSCVFEPGELGYVAPLHEMEKALSKYGAGRRLGMIEGTDAFLLEEGSKAGELKGVQGRMGALMGDASQNAPGPGLVTNGSTNGAAANGQPAPTNGQAAQPAVAEPPKDSRVDKLKQRVTVTKDGKKRIAPLLVSSSSGLAESSLPQTQLVSAAAAQRVRQNDAAVNIIDLSKPYNDFPKGGLAGLMIGNKRKFAEIEGDDERRIEKRLIDGTRNGAASILVNTPDGLMPPSGTNKPVENEVPDPLRPAIVNPSLAMSQLRLAVPLVRSVIFRTIDGSEPPSQATTEGASNNEDTVILEARNASGPSRTARPQDRDPTRVTCSKRGQNLWQDFLPKAALLLTGNTNFWAAACEDGSIYTWTPAGRRQLNALVVEAQPVIMDCRGWFLLCITAVGTCYIWNLQTLSSPHPPISLAPILDIAIHSQGPHLTPSPGIIFARLNSTGRLVVALSNGDGYTYSPSLFVWQRLSEPWWAVGSQYWNTTDSSVTNLSSNRTTKASEDKDEVAPENISAGIIPLLERNTTNNTLLRGRAFFLQRLIKALLSAEGFENLESSVSVAHLENRMAAALTLGAREEFRVYLLMYAKRLGAETNLKGKVEELLRSLLGNVFEDDGDEDDGEEGGTLKAAKEELCGWKREELLKEVVVILGKHRDLQRITVPYARLLGVIEEQPKEDGGGSMMTDI
ncbi:Hira-domain-containing protein [Saccharata proteae CBS 121410]|uniref:Protein HIR n=1 Tax=Saccharata proteae CBS 121410 TaxID=1314787 RepID=A0A6A5YC60_9PEZI|nr:Hira-domain-containing protein [Saccharata proteae CBS 121410]